MRVSGLRVLAVLLALGLLAAVPATAGAHGDDNGHRTLRAELTGEAEVPPVETEASGRATFRVNKNGTEIKFRLRLRNIDNALAVAGAHIHCAPAGENGPVAAFLAGPVNGGLEGRVDIRATLTEQNVIATKCGETLSELIDSMRAGVTYVNVHSGDVPSGELRGQILQNGGDD